MTSQLFWSASLTNVTLSPSAFTVPLSVLSGAAAAVLSFAFPMSQLLPMSCARAAVLHAKQTATTNINSFFIERHLLCANCPVKLDSCLHYESSEVLDG